MNPRTDHVTETLSRTKRRNRPGEGSAQLACGRLLAVGAVALFASVSLFSTLELRKAYAREREMASLARRSTVTYESLAAAQRKLYKLLQDRLRTTEESLSEAAATIGKAALELQAFRKEMASRSTEIKAAVRESSSVLAHLLRRELTPQRKQLTETAWKTEQTARSLKEVVQKLGPDPGMLKKRMLYPTVQLRGNGTVGSGVVVFSGRLGRSKRSRPATFILTAYHVVLEVTPEKQRERIKDVRIMGPGDRLFPKHFSAKVLAFDRKRDLALLQLEREEPFKYVAEFVSAKELQKIDLFEPAYAVGCPLGNVPLPTWGQITTKHKVVDGQVFWMLSAPTYFGNSGGGIFRASDARLLGIASMIYTYGRTHPTVVPHLGLFVPAEEIFAFLKKEGFGFLYDKRQEVPPEIALLGENAGTGRPESPGGGKPAHSDREKHAGRRTPNR